MTRRQPALPLVNGETGGGLLLLCLGKIKTQRQDIFISSDRVLADRIHLHHFTTAGHTD